MKSGRSSPLGRHKARGVGLKIEYWLRSTAAGAEGSVSGRSASGAVSWPNATMAEAARSTTKAAGEGRVSEMGATVPEGWRDEGTDRGRHADQLICLGYMSQGHTLQPLPANRAGPWATKRLDGRRPVPRLHEPEGSDVPNGLRKDPGGITRPRERDRSPAAPRAMVPAAHDRPFAARSGRTSETPHEVHPACESSTRPPADRKEPGGSRPW